MIIDHIRASTGDQQFAAAPKELKAMFSNSLDTARIAGIKSKMHITGLPM